MKIEKVVVKAVGRQIFANQLVVEERHNVACSSKYRLVKLDDLKFYLIVEPDYEGGFWDGLGLETKLAVELKKEFNNPKDEDRRGPKLCSIIEAAYNMKLW